MYRPTLTLSTLGVPIREVASDTTFFSMKQIVIDSTGAFPLTITDGTDVDSQEIERFIIVPEDENARAITITAWNTTNVAPVDIAANPLVIGEGLVWGTLESGQASFALTLNVGTAPATISVYYWIRAAA